MAVCVLAIFFKDAHEILSKKKTKNILDRHKTISSLDRMRGIIL